MVRNLFAILIGIPLAGCGVIGPTIHGNGKIQTSTRNLAPISDVELLGAASIELRTGPQSVEVIGDENLLPYVHTIVNGGTLKIKTEGNLRTTSGLLIKISAPEINKFKIAGSGSMKLVGVKQRSLSLSIAGSGSVSGTANLDRLDASIAGSGGMNLTDVNAKSAKASIAGSGAIEFGQLQDLAADVTGSGAITYHGKPRLTSRVTGSGVIQGR